MSVITRRHSCLTGSTMAGLEIGTTLTGTEIMPVNVGLWLVRDGDAGRVRWEVAGDSDDFLPLVTSLREQDHPPDGLVGYCVVVIGQILPADHSGWYVYGYCVGGELSPEHAVMAPYVRGKPVMPHVHEMRAAIADYLEGRYRDQMEAVAPHEHPRQTTGSDTGDRDGLPVATNDPPL